ncbi:MAG: DNA polymerase III subunit delta' [Desulfatibacillum sp.]|nr:DNA polymerase III subunit delta' [Desulfatibacillum sp.]
MDPVRHQRRALGFLSGILAKNNVAHALVFTGDAGLGKKQAAEHFAMARNCEGTPDPESAMFGDQGPCGVCGSCRKILSGNHPDVLFVEKDGVSVKIAQVRALLSVLAMRPSEAKIRVVVITDAGAMTPESSNALLKALEEPSETTCFVLLAGQKSELLPTVVSRCQEIRFSPLPVSFLVQSLEARGVDRDLGQACALLAGGSLDNALELASEQGLARRNWLINQICALEDQGMGQALLLAEFLARDKKAAQDDLNWIRTWLRDLLVSQYAPQHVINKDLMGLVTSRAKKISPESLLDRLQAVTDCEKDLARNVNTRLSMETLCLRLSSGG